MAKHPHWTNSPEAPDTKLEALLREHMAAQAVQHAEQMAAMNALLQALNHQPAPHVPSYLYPMTFGAADAPLKQHDNGIVTEAPAERWPAEPHFGKPRSTADIINSMWKQRQ